MNNGPADPYGFGFELPEELRTREVTVGGEIRSGEEIIPADMTCIFGFVYCVNGEGGRRVPEFIPTQYELEELARSYSRRLTVLGFNADFHGCYGSSENRELAFCRLRLDQIAMHLGTEKTQKIHDKARAEFQEDMQSKIDGDVENIKLRWSQDSWQKIEGWRGDRES